MAADTEWLEISLVVGGEAAEAVAEVLSRYIESGVVIESVIPPTGTAEPTSSYRVYAYLPIDERSEDMRQKIEASLWHLGQIAPMPAPEYQRIKKKNWMEAWREHFQPLAVGERLQVLPAWRAEEKAEERESILIEPGMGFGTGTHPTTQLSMVLMERHLEPGASMIDVGTGSGILAVAGAKLGASEILAVDIDTDAIESARETLALNGMSERIGLRQGSVDEILRGEYPLRGAQFVAANILARILLELFEAGLDRLVDAGGILVLSGILADMEGEILSALERAEFRVIERIQDGDWVALAAKKWSGNS